MTARIPPFVLLVIAAGTVASARGEDAASDKLSTYLVDVAPGAISASGLVGLSASSITQIQTSQDLVLAFSPGGAAEAKNGFGLAVTPARTTFMPMSGKAYANSPFMRALGSLTLSYAETTAEISGVDYKKSGYSIDTYYYLEDGDDPVIAANRAFVACEERRSAEARVKEALRRGDDEAAKKAQAEAEAAVKKCIDDKVAVPEALAKTRWNASRISLSAGESWIRPEASGSEKLTLGRSLAVGAQFAVGEQGAVNASFRRTSKEIDIRTLATTPQYSSSSIVAMRYTYGSKDGDGDLKMLFEVSNAKQQEVTAANAVFKYAVGIDKKLAKGTWLELRVGKNRSLDGTDMQTTSLFTVKFAPTTGLFN